MRNSKGQFQLGHGGGRPKGARNRLAAQVFEDILRHWCEPAAPGSDMCKGQEALETLYKEKPGEYLRLTASVLPREFIFENVTSDLDDEQIDELLLALRQRMTTKALPGSSLEVIETEFFFQLLVSLLSNPSRLDGGRQRAQARLCRQGWRDSISSLPRSCVRRYADAAGICYHSLPQRPQRP
jgi:hypothetical protein